MDFVPSIKRRKITYSLRQQFFQEVKDTFQYVTGIYSAISGIILEYASPIPTCIEPLTQELVNDYVVIDCDHYGVNKNDIATCVSELLLYIIEQHDLIKATITDNELPALLEDRCSDVNMALNGNVWADGGNTFLHPIIISRIIDIAKEWYSDVEGNIDLNNWSPYQSYTPLMLHDYPKLTCDMVQTIPTKWNSMNHFDTFWEDFWDVIHGDGYPKVMINETKVKLECFPFYMAMFYSENANRKDMYRAMCIIATAQVRDRG